MPGGKKQHMQSKVVAVGSVVSVCQYVGPGWVLLAVRETI